MKWKAARPVACGDAQAVRIMSQAGPRKQAATSKSLLGALCANGMQAVAVTAIQSAVRISRTHPDRFLAADSMPGLWSRCLLERGVQVVPKIVDVFAADAQAQEPGGHVTLSWELPAPLDGAFDAAQAGGGHDDLHGVAEAVGCGSVGDLEGQHCLVADHLRGGGAVPGVAGEDRGSARG